MPNKNNISPFFVLKDQSLKVMEKRIRAEKALVKLTKSNSL
jgi:hypothetical protein